MDNVFAEFDSLWSKSLINPSCADNKNAVNFHRARLDHKLYQDMLEFLKREFYNSSQNIYDMHLYLVERSLNNANCPFKNASALFINQAFVEFYNQLRNHGKKNTSETKGPINNKYHLTKSCKIMESSTNAEICYCFKNEEHVLKAFNLTVEKNLSLFSSFNKIYSFVEFIELIKPNMMSSMNKLNYSDQAILIGELQLQEHFELEKVIFNFIILKCQS